MMRLTCLLACLSLVLLTGCGDSGPPTSPSERGVVIIGIDALDWQVLDPVIDAGKAPTFARLRDESASGVNLSFVPLEKSPLIWASMATGLEPKDHGVGGFLRKNSEETKLLSSADWRAPALWDIAGAAGLESCVIGWWVTFPARPIQGVLVSDYISFTTAGPRNPEGLVRPQDLTESLSALTVDYHDVPLDLLRRFVPEVPEAQLTDPDDHHLLDLRLALAGDLTYLAIAKQLLTEQPYDLTAVYFRGLDLACHHFWQYMDAGDGRPASDDQQRLYGQIIPRYLEVVDGWLAELLAILPADINLIIASDHGFYGPRKDRHGSIRKGVHEHRPEGVLMVRSPFYTPGTRFDRSYVMNVAPIALAHLGLPASLEMPGRVLREGLTDDGLTFVEYLESNRIGTYASLAPAPPPEVKDDPALDEAVKKQLKSLGYVD